MEIYYESGDHFLIGAKEVGPGWTTPEMYFKSLLGHFGMARDTKTGWTNHLPTSPSLLELTIGQQAPRSDLEVLLMIFAGISYEF